MTTALMVELSPRELMHVRRTYRALAVMAGIDRPPPGCTRTDLTRLARELLADTPDDLAQLLGQDVRAVRMDMGPP